MDLPWWLTVADSSYSTLRSPLSAASQVRFIFRRGGKATGLLQGGQPGRKSAAEEPGWGSQINLRRHALSRAAPTASPLLPKYHSPCSSPAPDLLAQVCGIEAHQEEDEHRGQALQAHSLAGRGGLCVVLRLIPADALRGGQQVKSVVHGPNLQAAGWWGAAGFVCALVW